MGATQGKNINSSEGRRLRGGIDGDRPIMISELIDVLNQLGYSPGGGGGGTAIGTTFSPSGDISSTNVQNAILEVRDETDTKLASKENIANKSTNVATDQASSTKYPTVKSVFDWVSSTYQTILTKAGFTDINTGTDDAKYVTPLSIRNSNVVTIVRNNMTDADKTVSSATTEVYQSVALTASRNLTLPLANSVPAGKEIVYIDEIGGITSVNFINILRSGSDLINGLTTVPFNITNGIVRLVSDGASRWTTNQLISYTEGTWVPTWAGFSSNPTSVVAQYIKIGRLCTVFLTCINGTSNNATTSVTLPFTGGGGQNGGTPVSDRIYVPIFIMNNGTQGNSSAMIINGQNILLLKSSVGASDTFIASGGKGTWFSFSYLTTN